MFFETNIVLRIRKQIQGADAVAGSIFDGVSAMLASEDGGEDTIDVTQPENKVRMLIYCF